MMSRHRISRHRISPDTGFLPDFSRHRISRANRHRISPGKNDEPTPDFLQAIGYSIEHIRQMAKGLKALFDWSCT